MARMGIIRAMHAAIEAEMGRDPRVILLGEDVELGVWGYTRGLVERYGRERVRNTPICENTFTGVGVGAAMTGLRPIVDLMVANFAYSAFDQIGNQVAKLPYMTDGQLRIPMVMVAAAGAAGSNAAQHSDLPVAMFVNLGCVKVVLPSTPEDAAGLMTASIRDDDPVIFFYPAALGSERGEEFVPGEAIPLGVARIRRQGEDVTCWAPGLMARRALQAAQVLQAEGISVEVIDPRTLNPLDVDTVVSSVRKTGRFVAVDEAREGCSTANNMLAQVTQHAFAALQAPPIAVTAPGNVPVPYAPRMEARVIPSVDRIVEACRLVVRPGTSVL